jgi:coproporphyrinogen III oxidase
MTRIYAKSVHATAARKLVEGLQTLFVDKLEALSAELGGSNPALGGAQPFERVDWVRDGGAHGGGHRYVLVETPLFNRAAVNVSGVHYDDDPNRRLSSADALSTIIHPQHPLAPSVHMHFSWTEMRDGSGYYRMMADLNPSIEDPEATIRFRHAVRAAAPNHFEEGEAQGDHYFNIPALRRHRGVTHFYLEAFSTGHFDDDTAMARQVAEAAIQSYIEILSDALRGATEPSAEQKAKQLAYHTAYLFQVLTLDRGTTSGLLVHDQNDQGIMGSLPAYVDRSLLNSWAERLQAPQDGLVRRLVAALEDAQPSHVTAEVRLALAAAVREHYKVHPEALALQAKGSIVPPTVDNHS